MITTDGCVCFELRSRLDNRVPRAAIHCQVLTKGRQRLVTLCDLHLSLCF